MTRRVVVIGGGIAGLATAWLVRERARARGATIDLHVLESQPQAGGFTRTDMVDGYVCEWGPNGFLSSTGAQTLRLVNELGLQDRLLPADPASARRFVYHSGALHELPTGPGSFLRSHVVPASAKLRMLAEPLIPARRDDADESVDDFARRRLGAGFARYLLDPMVSGVFAGDPRALSLSAAFPKMAALEREHGGLFRAMLARRKAARKNGGQPTGGPAGPGGTLYSFRGGMGELTGTLIAKLGPALHTGVKVSGLDRNSDGTFTVATSEPLIANDVILACPAHAARDLVAPIDLTAAAAMGAIPFASVSVACEAYNTQDLERPLNGFGVLIPRSEGMRSLGTLCSDRIFPAHGTPNTRMLRTLVGGARDPEAVDLSPHDLSDVVHKDLRTVFGLRAAPSMQKIYAHHNAIAQYTVGHRDRVLAIDALSTRLTGLHFTGASYRGVSINGCVDDAYRLAESLFGGA